MVYLGRGSDVRVMVQYDPAKTTFIIPFVLVSKNCSLLFVTGRRIPILCAEPFAEIQLRLKGCSVEGQKLWLESLLEE